MQQGAKGSRREARITEEEGKAGVKQMSNNKDGSVLARMVRHRRRRQSKAFRSKNRPAGMASCGGDGRSHSRSEDRLLPFAIAGVCV